MTEIDWAILVLLLLSTIVGVTRGVIREVLAIVGWIVGIILAMHFAGDLAELIPLPSLGFIPRVILASVAILVATLFAFGLLGTLMRKLMEAAEISFEDRMLGAVFGLVRGVVVVCACVFIFGMLDSVHHAKMWRQSILVTPAQTVIDWSMPFLPDWLIEMRQKNISL